MEYTIAKNDFNKQDVNFLYLFFENGDYLSIDGSELIDLSFNVYDKLVRHDNGYCAVAESGYLKLKIKNHSKFINNSYFLYNSKAIEKDRKSYIENRCVNESIITKIWLFNEDNWHHVLLGNFQTQKDGEFLILKALPQPLMGEASGSTHKINLSNVKKEDVWGIDLDFENCESFLVYNSEIEEINLSFEKELTWGAQEFYRTICGGFIKLKLDKYFSHRENHLFDNEKLKLKDFEQRLCGKKGFDVHDICHLYIKYYHAGYGCITTECIEIDDIKPEDEIEQLIQKEEEEEDYAYYYYFESGYSKKLKDGTILITFGKNAKQTIDKLAKLNR
ncbi:MAG: hypothetical protein HDT29_07220 [Clostridiales bacterium]|nr:hypothetical protein [Clostridiales bacterium]